MPTILAIMESCVISPSQEQYLHLVGFHGQAEPESPAYSTGDDAPPDFPVAFTPIVIESFPESPQQEGGNEGAALDGLFETPPEDFASADGSQAGERRDPGPGTVPIDVNGDSEDSPVAVDLGLETDVVFSEADLQAARRVEAGSSYSQKSRVSNGGISLENSQLGDSASKRAKLTLSDSRNESATSRGKQMKDELLKLFEMLRSKSVSPSSREPSVTTVEKNTGSAGELEVELVPNHREEFETKRRLDFSAETVELETEVMKSVGQKENMDKVDELRRRVNGRSGEGSSDRGRRDAVEIDSLPAVEDGSSIRREKEPVKKRVLPPTVTGMLTFAGEEESSRGARNFLNAHGKEAEKFTENVTDVGVAEAVPITENMAEAGGGKAVTSTRSIDDASRGEVSENSGNVMDAGVGEAAATAEYLVEAGADAGERQVGEINVNPRDTMLSMLRAVMRNCELERSVEKDGILEIVKTRGMKFPRPIWWPPGKEI